MAEGCKEEARVEGSACILYNVDGGGPIMAPIIADDDATSIDSNYQSPSTQTRASPVASESTQRTKGTVAVRTDKRGGRCTTVRRRSRTA